MGAAFRGMGVIGIVPPRKTYARGYRTVTLKVWVLKPNSSSNTFCE